MTTVLTTRQNTPNQPKCQLICPEAIGHPTDDIQIYGGSVGLFGPIAIAMRQGGLLVPTLRALEDFAGGRLGVDVAPRHTGCTAISAMLKLSRNNPDTIGNLLTRAQTIVGGLITEAMVDRYVYALGDGWLEYNLAAVTAEAEEGNVLHADRLRAYQPSIHNITQVIKPLENVIPKLNIDVAIGFTALTQVAITDSVG